MWVAVAVGLVACRQASPTSASQAAGHTLEVRHVDPAGAAEMITESGSVVLDVRSPREYGGGHLPGAINIDFNGEDFGSHLGALDRELTYVVYCRSGNRSTRSLKVLDQLGFQSVVHLDGGITAWEEAEQPVER